MRLKNIQIFSLFGIIFLLTSCSNSPKPKIVNNSVGYGAELNITTTIESFKYLKKSLAAYVATPQIYLTPEEPFYRVNYIGVNAFKASYLEYQTILLIVTDKNMSEMEHVAYGIGQDKFDSLTSVNGASFTAINNVWAKNQTVFLLYGNSEETLRLYLKDYSKEIRSAMYKAEINNLASRICESNHPMSKLLKKKHGIEMAFPSFTKVDIKQDSYYSVNWQEGNSNCNLLIGILNPQTDSVSSKSQMLATRKSQGKRYLQMDSLGIYYIGTSKKFPQRHQAFEVNGNKGAKINGWWVIDGQFRGGPYTRYTLFHEATGQWISLEALVYFPSVENRNDGKSKTRYLRTLEAIIHTLK